MALGQAGGGSGELVSGGVQGDGEAGAVVQLLATAIEEGRDLSSMSGIRAGTAYRLLPA